MHEQSVSDSCYISGSNTFLNRLTNCKLMNYSFIYYFLYFLGRKGRKSAIQGNKEVKLTNRISIINCIFVKTFKKEI